MAKRNDPVARARGRKPAPVKKPFPVGFALGCAALVLLLGGIIVFAAMNQGLGDKSSLKYAEHAVGGLQTNHGLTHDHVPGTIAYKDASTTPPYGGNHNGNPESCQVYTAAIANENAVHSLEHGAVWVTYNPDKTSKADVATLKSLVEGDPYRMLSPYPGLKTKVSLQAWGEQIFADSVTDSRVKEFLKVFTNGPQSRERGAACQGTTSTGPLPTAPPVVVPTTKASPTPTKK